MTSEARSPLRVSDKPDSSSTAAHSQTGWVNLNCVTFIDESAQCLWDRGGAPSPAERCNAPIEEDTDGQPSSTARRPVPRNGMSVKRKPKRKYNIRGKGQRRSVSRLIFLCFYWGVSGWFSLVKTWAPDRRYRKVNPTISYLLIVNVEFWPKWCQKLMLSTCYCAQACSSSPASLRPDLLRLKRLHA